MCLVLCLRMWYKRNDVWVRIDRGRKITDIRLSLVACKATNAINQCPNKSLKFWCTNTYPPLIIFAIHSLYSSLPLYPYQNNTLTDRSLTDPMSFFSLCRPYCQPTPQLSIVATKIWFEDWGYPISFPRENATQPPSIQRLQHLIIHIVGVCHLIYKYQGYQSIQNYIHLIIKLVVVFINNNKVEN